MNDFASKQNLEAATKISDSLFVVSTRGTDEIIDFLNDTFREAVTRNLSDVHFIVTSRVSQVRFRKPGGKLETYQDIDEEWMKVIDDKIRSRAKISTTDRRSPQDGRISLTINGLDIDIRVSITPGVNGGSLIVCRILNQMNSKKTLKDIEMPMVAQEAFMRVINEPHGLFLITGPTGSGKTTTLYAMLNELNNGERNIITIEEPVEYRIPEFHQINVDGDYVTFAGALRAVLRQDPDIIMVGEIRDPLTAAIAVQAANTGHLVLSTTHANNAAAGIRRLVDLGVDPVMLGSALRCVTAQRLVRKIAPGEEVTRMPPNDTEKQWLDAFNIHRRDSSYPKVQNTVKSYKGYMPIMEIIMVDHNVKRTLVGSEQEIFAAASRQPQFETLAHAAERLAFKGITTLEEARSITSIHEAMPVPTIRVGEILLKRGTITDDDLREALDKQAELRMQDQHVKLGDILVEMNACTRIDLITALGYTPEAAEIIRKKCTSDEQRHAVISLIDDWRPGINSLFDIVVDGGIFTMEDIKDVQES